VVAGDHAGAGAPDLTVGPYEAGELPAEDARAGQEDRQYGGRSLEERRADQRTRLFDAARGVFAERGYAAASVEEVVSRAKVSRSTFYGFFQTKEDCLLALFLHDSERLIEIMREVSSSDLPLDRKVRVGVERFVEALARDPEMAQVVLIEAVGASERVERARAAVRSQFTRLIAGQLREAPHWRGRPREEAQVAAMATMAAVSELVTHLVATGRLNQWSSLVEPLGRYALRALGPDIL
jgi:AcrR family transcriptional regulator